MNGCTETAKPQISILMAIYEPRMDWLREQLLSLDAQTYPNIKLYIRDDCSPTVSYEAIQSCAQDCIRTFSYEIYKNEKNLGSNGTFERLTQEADGEYFAYCDQDDVWLPEKLEKLEQQLSGGASLVCSDVIVIDSKGSVLANSITQIRPRHIFVQGDGLASVLIYRNFVIGCTTLIRSDLAKKALPFAKHMVHDHYLAFFCALNGRIEVYPESLIKYRIHGDNQTGVLAKVTDRNTYVEHYLLPFCDRIIELQLRFSQDELDTASEWAMARKKNAFCEKGGFVTLWKNRQTNIKVTAFELIGLHLPQRLFRILIRAVQNGNI